MELKYIADSVQRQGGSRMQGRTKWVLIYATLRLLTIWSVRPNGLRLRQQYWPALGLRVSLMLACYAHTDGVEKQRIRYPDTLFYEAWYSGLP